MGYEKGRPRTWTVWASRGLVVVAFLFGATVVRADSDTLSVASLIAYPIVALFALAVEAAVVALLLSLRGMAPVRLFIAFFHTNVAVFVIVTFLVLHGCRIPLGILEVLVVAADGLCIKLLCSLKIFRDDEYEGVSWLRAMLVSCVGNAVSFLAGATTAHLL